MKKKIFGGIVVVAAIAFAVTYFMGGQNAKAAAGSYVNVSVFPENHFTVNADETWDATFIEENSYSTSNSKGLLSGNASGFVLENRIDTEDDILIHQTGDYYYRDDKCFVKDDEYGKSVEFDDNGRSNQVFVSRYALEPVSSVGVYYGDFFLKSLAFKDDGTFNWFYGTTDSEDNRAVEYQGTYTVNGDVITLKYNNEEHYLIYKDNNIYYDVYQKQ